MAGRDISCVFLYIIPFGRGREDLFSLVSPLFFISFFRVCASLPVSTISITL